MQFPTCPQHLQTKLICSKKQYVERNKSEAVLRCRSKAGAEVIWKSFDFCEQILMCGTRNQIGTAGPSLFMSSHV